MTPEEIVERAMQFDDCREECIEAIKQYAREMCDKQMQICHNNQSAVFSYKYPKDLRP
jgi:7-cyano-7-deazaguanine synthase in queuosine biosynthesis